MIAYIAVGGGNGMRRSYRPGIVLAVTIAGSVPAVAGVAATSGAAVPPAAVVPAGALTAGRHPLWVATYHGPQSGESVAGAELVSPDGATLFVAGFTGEMGTSGPYHWATVAYDTAAGKRLWVRAYQGTDTSSSSTAAATAVAVSPDGATVFVSGYVTNTGGVPAEATIAYNAATGATLWV